MSPKKKAPPQSIFARSTQLVGLAASLAQKQIAGKIQQVAQIKTQIEQAKKLVESLGNLKGAAMKAGQLLAIELRDYLPKEVVEILSQLQDRAPPVDFEEILSILRDELGPERLAQLSEISPTPIASASIGQVHRARWTDPATGVVRDLALKIQYRGIAEAIDSDLAMLARIARGLLSVSFKKISFDGALQEIKSVLVLETQYLREAEQLKKYREFLRDDSRFITPEAIDALTTQKVLAMSFEPGMRIEDWIRSNPPHEQRQRIAQQMLDLYFLEFYEWGLVQTDANFGNFLIRPETEQIVLLDFGSTKSYPLDFRIAYADFLFSIYRGDREGSLQIGYSLDMIDPRESEETKDLLMEVIGGVLRVFRPELQPFLFNDVEYVAGIRSKMIEFIKSLRYSPPPRQILFLHRKLGGIFSLLRSIDAEADLDLFLQRLETWLNQQKAASKPPKN